MTDLPARYPEALSLLSRVHMALDMGDADTLLACFAEGGVWHRSGKEVTGADAIKAIVTDRPKDRLSLHAVSNLCLDAEGDQIIASYFLTVSGSMGGEPARSVWILRCTDTLVETAEGLRLMSKLATPHMVFPH
jgi:hypothetical protein